MSKTQVFPKASAGTQMLLPCTATVQKSIDEKLTVQNALYPSVLCDGLYLALTSWLLNKFRFELRVCSAGIV